MLVTLRAELPLLPAGTREQIPPKGHPEKENIIKLKKEVGNGTVLV